jgi:hypothetical protein
VVPVAHVAAEFEAVSRCSGPNATTRKVARNMLSVDMTPTKPSNIYNDGRKENKRQRKMKNKIKIKIKRETKKEREHEQPLLESASAL